MNVGVIILCRYSSTRLPGKILKEIKGKPVLSYLIEKVKMINNISGFCVATSTEKDDDQIAKYCENNKISIYRGDLQNVAKRFYNCAVENNYDAVVRVNGDNIFLDSFLIQKSIDFFLKDNLDFLSNVKGRTYPRGMSIEIIKTARYKEALDVIIKSAYYSEHVMPFFYDYDKNYKVKYVCHTNNEYKDIDLALDTREDFKMATQIIQEFTKPSKEYSCKEIVELYKKQKV